MHVRRALNYAFDYDGFNKDILGGLVERNPTPLPNTIWGVPKDVKGYTYDIDKAKAELAKAAAKVDRPLEIHFLTGFAQSEQAAQLFQNGLTKIGVQSKVIGTPWPTIVERFSKAETTPDISVYWISTYYADPHNWIGEMFHSSNAGTFKNAHHYKNPKVDELLDKAVQSTDQAARAKLYEEATASSSTTRRGCGSTTPSGTVPTRRSCKGIVFCPIGNAQEMRTAYYE